MSAKLASMPRRPFNRFGLMITLIVLGLVLHSCPPFDEFSNGGGSGGGGSGQNGESGYDPSIMHNQ